MLAEGNNFYASRGPVNVEEQRAHHFRPKFLNVAFTPSDMYARPAGAAGDLAGVDGAVLGMFCRRHGLAARHFRARSQNRAVALVSMTTVAGPREGGGGLWILSGKKVVENSLQGCVKRISRGGGRGAGK